MSMKWMRIALVLTCIMAVPLFAADRTFDLTGWAAWVDPNSSGTFNSSQVSAASTVMATVVLAGTSAGNYILASSTASATAHITPALVTATVTADAKSRIYGDANPASGTAAASNNLVNGDTIASVSLSTPATIASNVGSYNLTGSAAVFGSGLASNYVISYATRANGLDVTQRTLTVTADNTSRGYGDGNPAFTASYSGFKNGETLATSGVTGSPSLTTSCEGSCAGVAMGCGAVLRSQR